MQARFSWHRLRDNKVFWPIVALGLIMLFNVVFTPGFFKLGIIEGHLYGNVIDILNRGSALMILALGMTLVIATGGVDLSVGAVVAISGATACVLINPMLATHLRQATEMTKDITYTPLPLLILAALGVSLLCGAWNGMLVAYLRIQPMVATLVLMVAGRGIAQLIVNGTIITVYYKPYFFIGNGYIFGLPFTLLIVAAVYAFAWLMTRRTAIGLFLESVGINARSGFFSGINEKSIKMLAYVFCGFCAGIAGLILSSNVKSADANTVGLNIELDTILAVVIGGTLMSGGRFSLMASIVGAMIIQATTTTMYAIGVPALAATAVKALVVLIVILIYSDQTKGWLSRVLEKKGTLT
jgi:galactofuranose transport system permease protein